MRVVVAFMAPLSFFVGIQLAGADEPPRPLVIEARIKDGPARPFETRIVAHLDRFDASRRVPLDSHGGWKADRCDATGFFHPKKIGNRWWLIDPDGHRFLHLAVNSVSPGRSPTNRAAYR